MCTVYSIYSSNQLLTAAKDGRSDVMIQLLRDGANADSMDRVRAAIDACFIRGFRKCEVYSAHLSVDDE